MSTKLAPIFLALTINSAYADTNSEFNFVAIDGTDPSDRVEIIPNGFTQRIGRLELSNGSVCTATLIAENLILTADHCTENEDLTTRPPEDFTFYAGYSHGEYVAVSTVTEVMAPHDTSADAPILNQSDIKYSFNDIAILVLEQPLGEVLGYETVRIEPLPETLNGEPFDAVQIGFNREYGRVMTGDVECSLSAHFLNPYVLSSFCKVGPMDSGSPQFVWLENANTGEIERQIVGVTSRSISYGSMATPTYQSPIIQNLSLK